jgi:hypothetical protein
MKWINAAAIASFAKEAGAWKIIKPDLYTLTANN